METGFGARLRARRTGIGLSLRGVEVATNGSVSNAYLSQIENGKIRNPSARVVIALAAVYSVEPAEMLAWFGEETQIAPPARCSACGQVLRGR